MILSLPLSLCLSFSYAHTLTGTSDPIVHTECIMVTYSAVILVMFVLHVLKVFQKSINKRALSSPFLYADIWG